MSLPRTRAHIPLLATLVIACGSNRVTSTDAAAQPRDAGARTSDAAKPHDSGVHARDTGADAGGNDAMNPAADAAPDAAVIGGDRPVPIHVPASYEAGHAVPLVMMLHGYSASGPIEEAYLDITAQSDARGFIYAYPNGTFDTQGNRFWNATDACCNLYGSAVDDSSYLSQVITEIEARYTIDPKHVFITGHSNGGFMAHRMACDHADQVAAIVSLEGAMWEDISRCQPSAAVSVVEIHGTADETIAFDGGVIGANAYPSAPTTVSDWVGLDGCGTTANTNAPNLDLVSSLPDAETTVTNYPTGCKPGGDVQLWTVQGGTHVPALSATFASDVVGYLLAHPKP
jgi:polyhydroxybutyrate depolymerase